MEDCTCWFYHGDYCAEKCKSLNHGCICNSLPQQSVNCKALNHGCICLYYPDLCRSTTHQCACWNNNTKYKVTPALCKASAHCCACIYHSVSLCRSGVHHCLCSTPNADVSTCKAIKHFKAKN
jgi:hypothetical protein